MKTPETLYQQYVETMQQAADYSNAAAVLEWDQEVYMPAKGFEFRSRQLATLHTAAHELLTGDAFGGLLQELLSNNDLKDAQLQNVRLSFEDYSKNKKLPNAFIASLSKQSSICYQAWLEARRENNFAVYAPHLQEMIALKKEQAQLYGFENHPYDALLDDYEKGANVKMLDAVFSSVKEKLTPLLHQIRNAQQVDDSFFKQFFPKEKQFQFSLEVLRSMGFDFDKGRQDFSEHPFTTSFSAADVRITTRVDEHQFASLLWSSIHEGGHALYEQGLPEEQYGLPLGQPVSLSIHESQSRLWENGIGRSLLFWEHFYPQLQNHFPEALNDVSLLDFYKGMNRVEPSFIRTDADELTYHFHVLIRYEIEKELIAGTLDPRQVSEVWNEGYKKHLGITPPDDKKGVLQDVHWSHGSFGYFPTYSLGSIYAAQFLEAASHDFSGLQEDTQRGDFTRLLHWLREKIHVHGRRFTSEELCKNITGTGLDFNAFMNYASEKYSGIYNLKS